MELLFQTAGERGKLAHVPGVGLDPAEAGQVRPDAGKPDARKPEDLRRHALQVPGQDAFPQVAELDHQDDAVADPGSLPCRGKLPDHAAFRD